MSTQPAIFVSHGAPTLILQQVPARTFLTKLSEVAPAPKAIVAVSAHWETGSPMLSTADAPETIHDFYGFPEPLYQLRYPAPGAPKVAKRAKDILADAGFDAGLEEHGLDHGAWVPLMLGYPDANVPVTQLSIQPHLGPEHHFKIGEALRPLRDEGVLILASGSLTHNLREFRGQNVDARPPSWVTDFDQWFGWAVAESRVDDLLHYRERAPEAVRNHPTEDHILPFFVALGAADRCIPGRHVHASHTYGVLAMDAYAFS